MNNQLLLLVEKIGFTPNQLEQIRSNYPIFNTEMHNLDNYKYLCRNLFDENYDISLLCIDMGFCAKDCSIKEGMFNLLFFIDNLQKLYSLYQEQAFDEQMFDDMVKDFKYKSDDFFALNGYLGTNANAWHVVFFRLNRFAFGRFQYEVEKFSYNEFTFGEISVKKGDNVIAMHIPSGSKMTQEDRLESYKKAYKFFKSRGVFEYGIMKVTCHSWMLFPPYKKLFSKKSNLFDFSNEFMYLYTDPRETFTDGWRIFGKEYNDSYKNLPRRTSLQRAFADYLNQDNPLIGVGYSIMLFDGKKIL